MQQRIIQLCIYSITYLLILHCSHILPQTINRLAPRRECNSQFTSLHCWRSHNPRHPSHSSTLSYPFLIWHFVAPRTSHHRHDKVCIPIHIIVISFLALWLNFWYFEFRRSFCSSKSFHEKQWKDIHQIWKRKKTCDELYLRLFLGNIV